MIGSLSKTEISSCRCPCMALKSRTISTSLTPRPSASVRPGYHIIAGSEVNGSGRCFILARSLAFHAAPPQRFCMDGWPPSSSSSSAEPRIITLLEVTPSASVRPPIVRRTRPKCERAAPRQDIFDLQEQLQSRPRFLLRPLRHVR